MKRNLVGLLLVLLMLVVGAVSADEHDSATVNLGGNDELGIFLVGPDGMTLYMFANDEPGVSNCTGQCLENWPPLTVEEDELPTLADGISGRLGVVTLDDGTRVVTYNGMPLYYWINDIEPGDATGHLVGDVWFVVPMPTVGLAGNDELGDFLVGPDGMTLYTFANDEPGVSNCTGGCLENWPALTVDDEMALDVQPGLVGEFDVIEREDDGSMQVTLNGMPLYYWINDIEPGDATGHEFNDVWFVATVPTLAVAENEELGEILVGGDGMTLYTFANDEAGVSNCVDGCAVNWPPLTVTSDEQIMVMDDVSGELGTIEREDGSLQVTYDGMPLYFWVRDVIPGDTTGHEFNDVWFVAQP